MKLRLACPGRSVAGAASSVLPVLNLRPAAGRPGGRYLINGLGSLPAAAPPRLSRLSTIRADDC